MTKDDQAELVTRLAHEQAELDARIEAEARARALQECRPIQAGCGGLEAILSFHRPQP
jgi:hypothetical protein